MVANRKYPVGLRERAVKMARDLQREADGGRGAISRVARDLGIHPEALRQPSGTLSRYRTLAIWPTSSCGTRASSGTDYLCLSIPAGDLLRTA
jgi:hypothetical protein